MGKLTEGVADKDVAELCERGPELGDGLVGRGDLVAVGVLALALQPRFWTQHRIRSASGAPISIRETWTMGPKFNFIKNKNRAPHRRGVKALTVRAKRGNDC